MVQRFVERHVRAAVVETLQEARAVCLLGARQTGKSTLARAIAATEHPAEYLTLDDEATRRAAREDPTAFVADIAGATVIDEVQRAPNLLLAIKERLDRDDRRGQFLLTGSANILTLPTIADALPGRVDYVRLWPFSQGELEGRRERFVDLLFEGRAPQVQTAEVGRSAYAARIFAGGFPEAQRRRARGRASFFASYLAGVIDREVSDLSNLREPAAIERLLRIAATRSAGLMSARGIASELGVDHKTVAAQTRVLENLFLLARLPPWHVNLGSRQIKTPKIHVTDTGLLAHLMNVDEQRLARDGTLAGPIFETFVAMEIARQLDWSERRASMFHYRDNRQREVDVVLELPSGEVAGVEIKTAATVSAKDFAGLRHLRDQLGGRFRMGVVLYTGPNTLSFGERLTAVPLCGLWAGTLDRGGAQPEEGAAGAPPHTP